jgi:hypothetical protein
MVPFTVPKLPVNLHSLRAYQEEVLQQCRMIALLGRPVSDPFEGNTSRAAQTLMTTTNNARESRERVLLHGPGWGALLSCEVEVVSAQLPDPCIPKQNRSRATQITSGLSSRLNSPELFSVTTLKRW